MSIYSRSLERKKIFVKENMLDLRINPWPTSLPIGHASDQAIQLCPVFGHDILTGAARYPTVIGLFLSPENKSYGPLVLVILFIVCSAKLLKL